MNTYFVTFRSVTFAQRGESVLRQAGIIGNLQRTPKWMEEQGCGYCIRLRLPSAAEAVAVLRQKQVPYRRVYRRTENGDVEEVAL